MISAHALRFHRDSSTHPTESQRRGTTWIQPFSFSKSSWIFGTRRAKLDFPRFVEVGHVQDQDLSRMVRPLVPDQLEGTHLHHGDPAGPPQLPRGSAPVGVSGHGHRARVVTGVGAE